MTVETDPGAGFCGGVIRAIGTSEQMLGEGRELYSLGSLVHNGKELSRLCSLGLKTVESLSEITSPAGKTVLVRAHGVAPGLYDEAARMGLDIADCTCPVVLKLQAQIKDAYSRMHADGVSGQVLLFGKVGHPEVLGLVGQVNGDVTVIEHAADLDKFVSEDVISTARPVELFSQTTKSPDEYKVLCESLKALMKAPLTVHDTICRQVATRHDRLFRFASDHDVLVFVAGAESSNGKILYGLCRSVNPRTHLVEGPEGLDPSWFGPEESIGVSGATSTPQWLLAEVARAIENLQ